MIRDNTGLERLMIFFTGTRLYRCRDCFNKFRAPDRRRLPRHKKKNVEKLLAGVSPGHVH